MLDFSTPSSLRHPRFTSGLVDADCIVTAPNHKMYNQTTILKAPI